VEIQSDLELAEVKFSRSVVHRIICLEMLVEWEKVVQYSVHLIIYLVKVEILVEADSLG